MLPSLQSAEASSSTIWKRPSVEDRTLYCGNEKRDVCQKYQCLLPEYYEMRYSIILIEFALREVHLRMLLHEPRKIQPFIN